MVPENDAGPEMRLSIGEGLEPELIRLGCVATTTRPHYHQVVAEPASGIANQALTIKCGTVGADVPPIAVPELLSCRRRERHQIEGQCDYQFLVPTGRHNQWCGPGAGDFRKFHRCGSPDAR